LVIPWVDIFVLPGSSRRVLAALSSSESLDFTQLKQKSGLPDRTLRFALTRLKADGRVREQADLSDMRKSRYSAVRRHSLSDAIGNTPLLRLRSGIFTKLESVNPSGSIKDRMASYMIEQAERRGELKPGSEILEATSGNTGIAFAMLSASKGYRFTAVLPGNMSRERVKMMEAFGASVVVTPAKDDIAGAIRKYEELAKERPDAWLPRQFNNTDNIDAHRGTGKEILSQLGHVDVFVAGVGTGGTLMGVTKTLKEANPDVRIVAIEPAESSVLGGKKGGPHGIQGIGEGFIPPLLDMRLLDEVIAIGSSDAIKMAARLAREEGLLVGISSGANVLAALKIAKPLGKGKNVVTVLPDRGERYLSTGLFNNKGE